jgi:hypothetical protein
MDNNSLKTEEEIESGKIKTDSSTGDKIDLLENQIHAINIKLNSPEKVAWFKKNASLIISIVALITSMFFNFYGLSKQKTKDEASARSSKIERVEQLTLKLTELAERSIRLSSEGQNTNVNALSVLLNYQRLIYVNEILEIIDDIDEKFPSDIYALLGNELRNDGQFDRALKYYKLSLARSQTPTAKVVAYRDLGNIFGIPNTPIFSKDSSRFYWNKSLEESEKILGEQKYSYRGYTYQLLANFEFYLGNSDLGSKLVDSAKSEYLKLPENNASKQYNIGLLSQMEESDERKVINKSFAHLSGEWNTNLKSDIKATIQFAKNANGWYCNMEIFETGKIIYSMSGPFISVSKNHMTFTLQGMKRLDSVNMYNDRTQVLGSIKLSPDSKDEKTLYVRFNEVNGNEKRFLVCKK